MQTEPEWRSRVVDWLDLNEAEREKLVNTLGVNPEPLMVLNMPNEVYHNQAAGTSFSKLKLRMKSAWAFKHFKQGETTAMFLGTLRHMALLEPEKLNGEVFALIPEGMRRDTRTQKYQDFLAEAAGRIPVLKKDWDSVREEAARVRRHPMIHAYLSDDTSTRIAESSIFWTHESGLFLKIRPDLLAVPEEDADGLSCFDLKTMEGVNKNAGYDSIQYRGEKWEHWPLASAHYSQGVEAFFKRPCSFIIIAAEYSGANEVLLYSYDVAFSSTAISMVGRGQHADLIEKLVIDFERDQWPRQHEGIKQMDPSPHFSKDAVPETFPF